MNTQLNYVAAVSDENIVINCNDKRKFVFLKNLGAKRKFILSIKWHLSYKTDADLATFFVKLRDEGFLFSYDQHGWGPSDVFKYLRKKNFLKGDFTEIYWRGLNKAETRKV